MPPAKRKKPRRSSKSKAKAQTRRIAQKRQKRINRRRAIILTTLLFLITLATALYIFFKTPVHEMAEKLTKQALVNTAKSTGTLLTKIHITGHENITSKEILQAMDLTSETKTPLWWLDLEERKARIEEQGWVKHASLRRHFPESLFITIEERQPIAIWQHKGKVKLIDKAAFIISDEVGEHWHLPILVGEDALFYAKQLFQFMAAEPTLFSRVVAITRIGGRRWNVKLGNGIIVKLPEKHPEKAWASLAKLQEEKQLLDREVISIDMRVPEKLFIQTP